MQTKLRYNFHYVDFLKLRFTLFILLWKVNFYAYLFYMKWVSLFFKVIQRDDLSQTFQRRDLKLYRVCLKMLESNYLTKMVLLALLSPFLQFFVKPVRRCCAVPFYVICSYFFAYVFHHSWNPTNMRLSVTWSWYIDK